MFGDSRLVKEFGKRFQREKFPCDYKEWQANHESMIATITIQPQFSTEYNYPSYLSYLDLQVIKLHPFVYMYACISKYYNRAIALML